MNSGTEPEASISDAVCSIVYAAPRTELKELNVLREMLMHKVSSPVPPAPLLAPPFGLRLLDEIPPWPGCGIPYPEPSRRPRTRRL